MKPAAPRAGFGFFFVREGWRFDAKNSLSGRPSQDRARWSGIDKPELTLANLDTFLAPVTLLSFGRTIWPKSGETCPLKSSGGYLGTPVWSICKRGPAELA